MTEGRPLPPRSCHSGTSIQSSPAMYDSEVITEGDQVTLHVNTIDNPHDDHILTIDWGDGTPLP